MQKWNRCHYFPRDSYIRPEESITFRGEFKTFNRESCPRTKNSNATALPHRSIHFLNEMYDWTSRAHLRVIDACQKSSSRLRGVAKMKSISLFRREFYKRPDGSITYPGNSTFSIANLARGPKSQTLPRCLIGVYISSTKCLIERQEHTCVW